ncbi:MAG: Gfo/Idh/MocA family oxidoreductase [Flavobacteriales bacterium]
MTKVLIIGAGPIGQEYARIVHSMGIVFSVLSKTESGAQKFTSATGFPCIHGGLTSIKNSSDFSHIIIAIPIEECGLVLRNCMELGWKNILVEKPGGLNEADIKQSVKHNEKYKSLVYVAYNRRYFASTMRVAELIAAEGGLLSFEFEFTEWSHVIEKLQKPTTSLENWLLANSTHVIDIAFYLGGKPGTWSHYKSGKLDWHPAGSVFTGAGITQKKIPFSYHANWQSAGRWGVELYTAQSKIVLRPLEKVFVQKKGELEMNEIALNSDSPFKPGFMEQTKTFLSGKKMLLPTLEEQYTNVKEIYSVIIS